MEAYGQIKGFCQFKPMSDSELSKALNLEEIELARAFGYYDESDNAKEALEMFFKMKIMMRLILVV